jgi:hypothetical protein
MSGSERAGIAAILACFLAITFSTCTRFPIVWGDEVYFCEPAVNANLGLGFTSYAGAVQPHGHFWAGNTPLYSMLLAVWLKVFGIGMIQVRSFGYTLAALTCWILVVSVFRLKLITSPRHRLWFLLTLLLAYGPNICYRGARYDTLSMLLVSLVLFAASLATARLRLIAMATLGALLPLTQLSLVVFAVEIGALLFIFGRLYVREAVALGIGAIIGGAILYGLLDSQSVWSDFVAFIRHQREIRDGGMPKDPSFPLVLVAGVAIAADQLMRRAFRWKSPLAFGLAAGVMVPFGQLALGWFPTYYTWMAILPVAVGIFSEFSRNGQAIRLPARGVAAAALVASALLGAPMQLASALEYWHERDYSRVAALVQQNVGESDQVYCDPQAYYPAKQTAQTVFLTTYDQRDRYFTIEEKRQISVIIVPPNEFERATKRIGGEWSATGTPIRPPEKPFLFFRNRFGDKLVANYNLQVYRRAGRESDNP